MPVLLTRSVWLSEGVSAFVVTTDGAEDTRVLDSQGDDWFTLPAWLRRLSDREIDDIVRYSCRAMMRSRADGAKMGRSALRAEIKKLLYEELV